MKTFEEYLREIHSGLDTNYLFRYWLERLTENPSNLFKYQKDYQNNLLTLLEENVKDMKELIPKEDRNLNGITFSSGIEWGFNEVLSAIEELKK